MYKAFAAGQLTEAEAHCLDALIEVRAAIPTTGAPIGRPSVLGPVPLLRWKDAAPGPLQAGCRRALAARFTFAEQSVLAVIAV